MAVTITRSVWIDDDGTGTTGTVINQALHTTLYNEIDTALAKVAQLAGGNAFTGKQTFNGGDVCINAAAPQNPGVQKFWVSAVSPSTVGIGVQNTDPSNSLVYLAFYNSAGAVAGLIQQTAAATVSYGTASDGRLKDDAGRATDVAALRAVVVHDFTWKADGTRARGVFAQEAAGVFPRAVMRGADDTTADGSLARPWMTDYSKFVPDLIVGWQQHDAAIADLRARLATVAG
jgi:hypothetical protein